MKEKKDINEKPISAFSDDELYSFMIIDQYGQLIGITENAPKDIKKEYRKFKKTQKKN